MDRKMFVDVKFFVNFDRVWNFVFILLMVILIVVLMIFVNKMKKMEDIKIVCLRKGID